MSRQYVALEHVDDVAAGWIVRDGVHHVIPGVLVRDGAPGEPTAEEAIRIVTDTKRRERLPVRVAMEEYEAALAVLRRSLESDTQEDRDG
jgi:hypothetical protein